VSARSKPGLRAGLALAAVAATVALALPGRTQPADVVWDLVNEYPATSIAGEADALFAELVRQKTGGRVVIRPMPGATSGLRSREQLVAVTDGRVAMADSFGGALGAESPAFLLSSLPLVASSLGDARALYATARPLYERLFAGRHQKLLFVTPWPPSGIWSAAPVGTVEALKALRIRTYDKTATDVFSRIGAQAQEISFADVMPKLQSGEINAVLSSGDGGAGRALWQYLRHFSEIVYTLPLSFGAVSADALARLDDGTRAAVEEAGRETTERQWAAMSGRVAMNYEQMRRNGVVIDTQPPPDVIAALRASAEQSLNEWEAHADPDAVKLLRAHRARSPR